MKEKNEKKSKLEEAVKKINRLQTPKAIKENYNKKKLLSLSEDIKTNLSTLKLNSKKLKAHEASLMLITEAIHAIDADKTVKTKIHSQELSAVQSILTGIEDQHIESISLEDKVCMNSVIQFKTIPEIADAFSVDQLINTKRNFELTRSQLGKMVGMNATPCQRESIKRNLSLVSENITRCNKAIAMLQRQTKKQRLADERRANEDRTCERSYAYLKMFKEGAMRLLTQDQAAKLSEEIHQTLDMPLITHHAA